MKILETAFLIFTITIPTLLVLIMIIVHKKVKRNKKFRTKLLVAIVISLIFNFSIYGVLKTYNQSNSAEEKIQENSSSEQTSKEEKEDEKIENTTKNVTSKGYVINVVDGVTYIDGYLIVNKTYTLPSNFIPTNTHKTVTEETTICTDCISEETYNAYTQMRADATSNGLSLWIASGYRSYSYQNSLYSGYVKRSGQEAADTFSARAGHSEHQSGLAFDLNSVSDAFASTKEGIWVNDNCYKYGFIIRYPKGKEYKTGYKYEPWHLRYVGKELAEKLYNNGEWITMEEYFGITSVYSD